jgi:hypothetical protein
VKTDGRPVIRATVGSFLKRVWREKLCICFLEEKSMYASGVMRWWWWESKSDFGPVTAAWNLIVTRPVISLSTDNSGAHLKKTLLCSQNVDTKTKGQQNV